MKSYRELIWISSFIERFRYLRLTGHGIGDQTFGGERYLNQLLYQSSEWRNVRDKVLIRDGGFDLGFPGHEIVTKLTVHHINPITRDDVRNISPKIFNLDNLITTSFETHRAIHYGNEDMIVSRECIERFPDDSILWNSIQ